jgi:uncharacterized protein involved in exopolysaccharide biosynthesis
VRRYIESALRLKWRLLAAALLVTGVAFGALFFAKQGYSSSATVWVEQPIYLSVNSNWNSYVSPAVNQMNVLQELLRTQQFSLDVARGARIPLPNDEVAGTVVADIQRNVSVTALGDHLVKISYTNRKPDYCKAIVTQVITLFTKRLNETQLRQSTTALQLYTAQRDEYQTQMEKSRDALAKFLRNDPSAGAAGAPPNPGLLELQQQYVADRSRYDDIVQKIDGMTLQSQAASQASDDLFHLTDQPGDPTSSETFKKNIVVNGGLALAMGLFTILGLTLVVTWLDPGLHTLNDVRNVVAVEDDGTAPDILVGAVPYLRPLAERRKAAAKAAQVARKAGAAAPAPATGPLSEEGILAGEPVHPAAFEGLNARGAERNGIRTESETIQVG